MPDYFVPAEELPYDPASPDSILTWAESLRGKTLREVAGEMEITDTLAKDKGGFGKNLEIVAFRYKPNSDPGPDLPEAGIEIKSLPVIKTKTPKKDPTGWRPKERLQLHNINYMEILGETWETCSLRGKCALMLVVTDEYEKGVSSLDLVIRDAFLLEFPIEEDEPTIRKDWEYVYRMVEEGRAHELSSSETTYLDVAPHGQGKGKDGTQQPRSEVKAKRRGFALKQSYMRTVYSARSGGDFCPIPRGEGEAGLDVESLIERRFAPHLGSTKEQIADEIGIVLPASKNKLEVLNNAILGLSRGQVAEEYGKAGYLMRNLNFEATGTLEQSVSFPYIRIDELLAEEVWEESLFRTQITSRMCLTLWQKPCSKVAWQKKGHDGQPPSVLRGIAFVGVPDAVVDTAGRAVWEQARKAFAASDLSQLPGQSFNGLFHVRPHATRTQSRMVLPDGSEAHKQCFWINNTHIRDLILDSRYRPLLEVTNRKLLEQFG